jgi:hypothetical protein
MIKIKANPPAITPVNAPGGGIVGAGAEGTDVGAAGPLVGAVVTPASAAQNNELVPAGPLVPQELIAATSHL